uniref:C3H1-type domain-containing protein n=1 Tax=Cacopsylla melanoneura TaxID=428564 RepID=A0A8D8PTE3_9HEMI
MLPTQGYFKEVECPYYVFTIKGSCNRPHCHFKHSRREHDYDFSEPPVVEDPVPNENELKEQEDGDVTPEESEEEIETRDDSQESSNDNDQNINQEQEKQEIIEPNNEEDEGGGPESDEEEDEQPPEQEIDDFDIEENLLRFKKALMNAIKKVIETYHKIFCKNINTKDFNQLIDEFIKNLINYEEVEAAEFNKVTYNPTPIIELKRQEKRIKTQLPYIPECIKATVNESLDIDSDLKFLEDLIQNDSLFSNTDSSHENGEQASVIEETNKKQKESSSSSSRKDKKDEVKDKEKSSRDKDRHKKTHSKSSHDLSSSSKDRDSKSSSSKSSSSSKERHKSSSESSTQKQSSSSSKDSKSQNSSSSHHSKSSSGSSKHTSSHKRNRSSNSHSHSDENKQKKSKHSSSSKSSSHHKSKSKAESSTIVISSESSEEDQDNSYDIYSNMDVDDDTNDNGENVVANDNTNDKHKESEEENYDEPDYIRKKKKQRIAHIDIFGIPSNPEPVSKRAKVLNPNERFKQIQEKYKGLNRPAHAQSSSKTGEVKIPPVPNVSSFLTAKKTLTQPPSLNINKNSLLMNDILKRTELKKTIAQTSKKNNRVAHVPSTGSTVTKPLIQVDATGTRIPLVVRQTSLDRIFALYSKHIPPDLASSRARQVESETYDKCHATNSYQNSIANSILRIRKEQSAFFTGSKPQVR